MSRSPVRRLSPASYHLNLQGRDKVITRFDVDIITHLTALTSDSNKKVWPSQFLEENFLVRHLYNMEIRLFQKEKVMFKGKYNNVIIREGH